MDDNLSILIKAILDENGIKQDIKDLDKIAEKYTLNFKASIDRGELTNSIKAVLPKIIADVNKTYGLKLPIDVDDKILDKSINQYQSAMKKMASEVNKIQLSMSGESKNSYSLELTRITEQYKRLGLEGDKLTKANENVKALEKAHNELADAIAKDVSEYGSLEAKNKAIISADENRIAVLNRVTNEYKEMALTAPKVLTDIQRLNKAESMQKWADGNSKAIRKYGNDINHIIQRFKELDIQMNSIESDKLVAEFKDIQNIARQTHLLGMTTFDKLKKAWEKFGGWSLATGAFTKTVTGIKDMITKVIDLDTALVDLKKTANMSSQELEDFYYASSDIAKQMGVTTKEIIDQASAWSRLGFNTAETATQMAKLSSQFKLISPGMTSDEAVEGLVSVMKAYGIEVDDVLDGIMSKVNVVGNKFALSNSDIIAMLQDSVSAMAEGNNTLEETIALETAAFEIAQDRSVGNGFKTVALRLRGINEETMELDDSLKTIKGDLYDLTGVSVMQDADTFKSTYQILKDMNTVWDNLSDKTQADALELMFGKQRANIGASVLKNFDAAERAMEEMAKSAGNAEAEMKIAMDSIEYKLTDLGETGTAVAQNLFGRENMKTVLDGINVLGDAVEWLTDKLGLFGTIGLGAGLFAGVKNAG